MAENREPDFKTQLNAARVALLWERLWPALFAAILVVGVFLALALFDLPPRLPAWGHAALIALFAAGLIASLVLAVREFRLPSRAAARRRLETASGLTHRPLAALEDRLAGADDGATALLWQAHRRRMAEAARHLRIGTPRAGWLRRDPYALRAALGLVLLLGAIDAGSDALPRIGRALNPALSFGGAGAGTALDIWITPPQYTGLAPQFLPARPGGAPVAVPVGSAVLAQVHGGGALPKLVIDGKSTAMTRIDSGNFKGEATIQSGSRLAVEQGWSTLGSWPIKLVPDLPPTVAFAKPPQATARAALRLEYSAQDDYGVEGVKAVIRRPGDPSGETLSVDLPLPDQHLKKAAGASFNDLTASRWAGLPVQVTIIATDALGQSGESETIETILPERIFHHPIARALIDERKDLIAKPEDREIVAEALADLSSRPGLYNDDIVAFLALRSAADRLILNRDAETVPAVAQLLWDTAVRIEDGRSATSEKDLRQSMQALQDALARNAPQAEIDRLMQELQQQIDRYLTALAQQGQKNPRAQQPADPSQTLTGDDLKQLLDRARELSRTGARDQARDMLAQLQELLENLRGARPMPMQSQQGRSLNAMQDLVHRQQQLLDRSFRQSRQSGGARPGASDGDAREQELLQRSLGDLMRQLSQSGGEIPAPLSRAERAMQGAAEALRDHRPGQAIGPQTEALDALQQAARSFAQKMTQGYDASAFGDPTGHSPQPRRDPFGRLTTQDRNNGGIDEGAEMRMGKSANEYAVEKAREILDELRRRAGEPQRPALERDYIDRLLREF